MKDDDPHFTYNVLMQRLRTARSPAHRAACLDSLRESPRAINLITIADTDLICEQLQAPNRNVRLAAIRLTGEMPSDEQVVTGASATSGRIRWQRIERTGASGDGQGRWRNMSEAIARSDSLCSSRF